MGNESWIILTSYWHPQAQRRSLPPKFPDRPKKQKKPKSTKNPKNGNFQNPRVSSAVPKYPKLNLLTKIGNFQNRQKINHLNHMVGWVGNESWGILTSYWHPQAQRRSLPPKFSDRPKNQKNQNFEIDPKSKKLKFPELPSLQWPPKIRKNQIFDKNPKFSKSSKIERRPPFAE